MLVMEHIMKRKYQLISFWRKMYFMQKERCSCNFLQEKFIISLNSLALWSEQMCVSVLFPWPSLKFTYSSQLLLK